MLRRLAYIENRRVLADSGEITTDVVVRDPVTALWVEIRAENGASGNQANLLAQCVDAIELIDGSEVLYSLDGYEAFSRAVYKMQYIPYNLIAETEGLTQNLYVPILFGRWLGDEQMSFDPTKFSNPQVRFKWNLAAVRAVGATGFVSGSGRLTVLADVMEGAPAPVAMLTAKQHYTFVTASSGTEYIDLPTDLVMRGLYIRCHQDGVGQFANITNVKVNCDQGKFVEFDMPRTDFLRWLTMYYPPYHYKHIFKLANGDTAHFIPKLDEQFVFQPETPDSVVNAANNGIGQATVSVVTAGTADTNKRNVWSLVHGWLPFGTAFLPFGDPDEPDTWFQPGNFKSVRLELTQGIAGADAAVVVEQARSY